MPADPESFVALGSGFARDRTHVWFRGSEIAGVDAAAFVALPCEYGHDGVRLVHRDQVFEGDARSFEVLGESGHVPFARDRERVYCYGNVLEGADAGSFAILGAGLEADRHGAWAQLERITVDRETLRVLDADYACDRERARFRGQPLVGPLAGPFVVLGHGYASDGARVFCHGLVQDYGPEGLRVLGPSYAVAGGKVMYWNGEVAEADPATWQYLGYGFGKDARHVYFDGYVLEDADPATFVLEHHVEGRGWARDAGHVWYREYQSSDYSDGESIELVEGGGAFIGIDETFARVGDRVLRCGREVADADAATFRALGGGWYADAGSLWFDDRRVPVADVESVRIRDGYAIAELDDVSTLRSLGHGYATDARRVLYAGFTLDGPDPRSARSLGGGYLVEADAAWFFQLATESRKMPDFVAGGGRLDGADPASLRRDRGYAIDGAAVYCGVQRIDGADAATFRALDAHHGGDGRAVYFDGRAITGVERAAFRVLGGVYASRGYTMADINGITDAWATDGTTLFLQGRPVADGSARYLSEADRELLEALVVPELRVLDRWYATDGRVVLMLRDGAVDAKIEPRSFEVLGHGYARDHARVFGMPGALAAERDRFHVLADGYAADGTTSWYNGHPIQGSHGKLYTLGGGWARDDVGIIGAGTRIDADPDTFVVLGAGDAAEAGWDPSRVTVEEPAELWWGPRIAVGRDKDRMWWSPYESGIPASVVVIAHGYALGDSAVFHAGHAVECDVATFTEIGDGYARDAYRGFFHGRPTR